MRKFRDSADEIAARLTPIGHEIPTTPESLQVFRDQIATALRDVNKPASVKMIRRIIDERLREVHGAKSIDWVLGYQACAKAILNRLKY